MGLARMASIPGISLAVATSLLRGASADDGTAPQRPGVRAVRTTEALTIDGILSEAVWSSAPRFTEFRQLDPVEGDTASLTTIVMVAYDDAALYVGARMFDPRPDSIVARLSRRDSNPNSDMFQVYLDPYHDRLTGFFFGIDAAGTFYDGTLYNDSWNDNSWDGVWEGAAHIDNLGWSAELRIPFSQLRFGEADQHVWGINFRRDIARRNESDFAAYTPKNSSGFVSRFPDLTGLSSIDPPHELEILPYLTTKAEYSQHPRLDPFHTGPSYTPGMGADIKWGLMSNLTLDAAINPDFGQVEVDPAVVNISDVETFYSEKRPFFLEGASIFTFGRGGSNSFWSFNWSDPTLFYSRRIGRTPEGAVPSADYANIPSGTNILGAAKLTGKFANHLSIGTIQSVTAREFADLQTAGVRSRAQVEPLTYYGVTRVQQERNDGRQGIGLLSTSTVRDLSDPLVKDEFNGQSHVLGLDGWTFLDSARSWVLTGWGAGSRVTGDRQRLLSLQSNSQRYLQRPDARNFRLDSSATSMTGFAGRAVLNKQKGNVLVNSAIGVIEPTFDCDDLGFLFRSGVLNAHVAGGYQWVEPTSWYRTMNIIGAFFRSYDFDRDIIWEGVFATTAVTFPNYMSTQLNWAYNPPTVNNLKTRGGPLMMNSPGYEIDFSLQSDNRRDVVFTLTSFLYRDRELTFNVTTNLEWRPAPSISLSAGPMFERDADHAWYVATFPDPAAVATYGSRYIFARLQQSTLSANIRLNWTFTPKLSLQLFIQPLISAAAFSQFRELSQSRIYNFLTYGEGASTIALRNGTYTVDPDGSGPIAPMAFSSPDFNVKSLRGNAVLRWEYMPGSTLYFVWTQSRTRSDAFGEFAFGRSLHDLVSILPDNIFMIKITYWWNA